MVYMEHSWAQKLESEFSKPYFLDLQSFLSAELRQGIKFYPPADLIFSAFCNTSFEDTKVVIIGQDPYHGPGQAHGLSFSVPLGVTPPPSLQNIFKEISRDLHLPIPNHGNLIHWAKQGVLLLNATLTVRDGEPKSHYGRGWEIFTDKVVELLSSRQDPIVFLLWGKSALEKCQKFVDAKHHLILKAPHPSPFSAHSGFFGCSHFSKTNEFLTSIVKTPIDWRVL
jgi:uracil-DNA glycosylase